MYKHLLQMIALTVVLSFGLIGHVSAEVTRCQKACKDAWIKGFDKCMAEPLPKRASCLGGAIGPNTLVVKCLEQKCNK
jgi:hypothetical protein